MVAFTKPEDIGNRAAQHLRAHRFVSFSDFAAAPQEIGAAYERLREAELRRRLWRFAIRRVVLRAIDVTTQTWTPPAYSASTTYARGAVVIDTNGEWWQSNVAGNVGITPTLFATQWSHYFGQDSFDPFTAPAVTTVSAPANPTLGQSVSGALGSATYYVRITYTTATGETQPSGEVKLAVAVNSVLTVASPAASSGATAWNVYVSTIPGQETLQSAGISIGTGYTEPTTGLVIGQFPPSSNTIFYHAGELTTYGGSIYMSLVDSNSDTPPTQNWLLVGGTATRLQILYPIGAGPRVDRTTSQAFRLPKGYLRKAPADPKGDMYNVVGVPAGPRAEDWVLEGDYFVSRDIGPVLLRFVANMVDVPDFDPMFCEGFAARLAEECATAPEVVHETETWTIKDAVANARAHYKSEIAQAGLVNGIEVGSQAPFIDDWITARY